jgi:oxalate decarboxylase/phosphoglucose isomerase-like protein (cupin superfamily)
MSITVCAYDPERLQAGHNGTILSHAGLSLPGTPFGSAFGVLRAGMAQERMRDPRQSKIYVPMSGEATLVTPEERVPLRPGCVYLIPVGTEHVVEHAGEADFVNFCLWWAEPDHG